MTLFLQRSKYLKLFKRDEFLMVKQIVTGNCLR